MSELGLPVIRTADPAPLEGQDVPTGQGAYANFRANMETTLGYGLASRFIRGHPDEGPDAEEPITLSHDEASKQMQAQGYDSKILPQGDVTQKVVNSLMMQQSDIAKNQDLARRAHLGGVTAFVTGLAGGGSDPLFLGLGPLGKVAEEGAVGVRALVSGVELSQATRGAGLVSRTLTGAAEGAGVMGGYTEAQKLYGTAPGDRDITSYDLLRQMGYGAALGGGVKATFGQRLTLDKTAQLERSANAAPGQGVTEANVVSQKGAIGRYQIMPDTARQYMGKDFDVQTLHDPKVNEQVAQKILDDLNEKFPNDAEAQAVAYNAGPGRAAEWLKAGRDDTKLPAETQDYLKRLRGIDTGAPQDLIPAARTAEGKVIYGKRGQIHADLPGGVEDSGMGFAKGPGEPFMTRDEATAWVRENQPGRIGPTAELDASLYKSAGERDELERYNSENPVEAAASLPAEVKSNAAMTSVAQAMEDDEGNVAPVIKAGLTGTTAGLEDAIPKPGSAIINDRLNRQMLDRINQAQQTAPKAAAASATGENPELAALRKQATDAMAEAEHAHQMAFGENGKPFKEVMDAHIEEHASGLEPDDRAIHESPDLAKAVDAAVRCSVVKGVE